MAERTIDIETNDGEMPTFTVWPDAGGPFPAAIIFMDAVGVREELRDMARRLSMAGYFVALPNLYYREKVFELGRTPTSEDDPAFSRMVELMRSLSVDMVMRDTQALVSILDATAGVAKQRPIGCLGYCMSGRYSVQAAATFPQRVGAAASFYGTWLVTDKPDSPHKIAASCAAELYFGCAENDQYAPLETVAVLKEYLQNHANNATVEIYPDTEHGFAFPERREYNDRAAELHWERILSLFDRQLN